MNLSETTESPKAELSECPAYRIILNYHDCKGTVYASYNTPEEAWQDPHISIRFVGIADYDYYYKKYLETIKKGKYFCTGLFSVVYCRISSKGGIIPAIPQ